MCLSNICSLQYLFASNDFLNEDGSKYLPSSLELSYNATQALAVNANALATNIWCYPVWWDCATDEEYNNYH